MKINFSSFQNYFVNILRILSHEYFWLLCLFFLTQIRHFLHPPNILAVFDHQKIHIFYYYYMYQLSPHILTRLKFSALFFDLYFYMTAFQWLYYLHTYFLIKLVNGEILLTSVIFYCVNTTDICSTVYLYNLVCIFSCAIF